MAFVGPTKKNTGCVDDDSGAGQLNDGDRTRTLRSEYNKISNQIMEKRENLSEPDSEKFNTILNQVEQLHESVQNPREQVADAEILLNLTNIIATSVKSLFSGGIKPSDFISSLLRGYATTVEIGGVDGASRSFVHWKDIGDAVSPVFMRFTGCSTMIGPLKMNIKKRKVATRRAQTKRPKSPTSCPKELGVTDHEKGKTDTDTNMATMFDILKSKMRIRLESLILNRTSFAQTVENLFALSFLAKDGRAEITIDENGHHIVAPKDAPSAMSVQSGEAVYNHFVFRFDFQDWQLMLDYVPVGEELMPHRHYVDIYSPCSSKMPIPPEQGNAANVQSVVMELSSENNCPIDEDTHVEIIQEKGRSDGHCDGEHGFPDVVRGFSNQKVYLTP